MKTRIISAIVLLALVVPAIFIGGYVFYFLAAIAGLISFRELMNLKEKEKDIPLLIKILAMFSFIYLMLSNINVNSFEYIVDYRILTLIMFLMLIPMVFYSNFKKYNINDALFLIGGIFFLGFAFNYLITIRVFDINYLIFLLLITIISDTFAWATGLLIGRHKLASIVSPKKTWEGLIGGTVFGTFISTVFYISTFNYTGSIYILILVILSLSLIGQLGDLVFSSIKRYYKTKDFSDIIPGHGGILDRIDSILFVGLAFSFIVGYL